MDTGETPYEVKTRDKERCGSIVGNQDMSIDSQREARRDSGRERRSTEDEFILLDTIMSFMRLSSLSQPD